MAKQEKRYTKQYVDRLKAKISTLEGLVQKYEAPAQRHNAKNKNAGNKKDRFNFWKNVGLVLFTGIIAALAIFQYVSFEKFSKKNTRAYLSVVNPILDTLTTYGIDPRITFTVKNTGNTPAYNVTSVVSFEAQWRSTGPVIPDTTNPVKYIYAPGSVEHTKLFKQVSTLNDSTVEGDELRRFFFGRFEYFDIFDEPHWLTFAYEFVWRNKEEGEFQAYTKYNDTDKN